MRRLLSTVKKWESLSILQLRDELARRGLKRAGTRTDLVARLEASEVKPIPDPLPTPPQPASPAAQEPAPLEVPKPKEPEISPPEPVPQPRVEAPKPEVVEERLPEVHLDKLPKKYLVEEILRRKPTESISLLTPKRDLLSTLQSLLVSPHLSPSHLTDFRSLLISLRSPHLLSLRDLLRVLKKVVDLDTISQNDLNILVNSESVVMDGMWRKIYSAVEEMEPDELVTVLKTMHMFRYVLRKEWGTSEQEADEKILKDICARLSSLHPSIPLLTHSSAIQLLRHHTKLPHIQSTILLLQASLLRQLASSLPQLSTYSPTDLFLLFESLPDAAYMSEQLSVKRLIGLLFDSEYNWSNEQSLNGLYTLKRLQAPVPISLSIRLSAFSKDYLKRMSASSLLSLLKTMGQTKCLTVRSCSLISEILSSSNYTDPLGISFYLNAIQCLADNKYLSFMLGKPYIFGKIMINEDRLDLWMMIRLCGWVGELLESDRIVTLTTKAVVKARSQNLSFKSLLKPIDSALATLVPTLWPQPLYHYQYLSYQFKDVPTRTVLCQHLAAILLQNNPSSAQPGLLAYLASPLSDGLKEEVVWAEVDRANLPNFLLAALKFHQTVPRLYHTIFLLLNRILIDNPSYYELFLISKFCSIDINSEKSLDDFQLQKQVEQKIAVYVNSMRKGRMARPEYILPTLDNLGLTPTNTPSLMGPMQNLLPQLHLRSVYNEPLVLSIIYLSLHFYQPHIAVAGVPNLAFPPPSQYLPKVTANRLIQALAVLHKKYNFDVRPIMETIKLCEDSLEDATIVEARDMLETVEDQLQEKTAKKIAEENKRSWVQKEISLGKEAFERLEAATQRKEILLTISDVLKYVNVLDKGEALRKVIESVKQFELWSVLSLGQLTEIMLLYAERQMKKEDLPSELLEAFTSKLTRSSADPDQLSPHPVTKLLSYSPFTHTSILEPRYLTSDLRSNLVLPSAQLTFDMLPEDKELYKKVNAVANQFAIVKPKEVEVVVKLKGKEAETIQCMEEFAELYASLTSRKPRQKPEGNYFDQATGWNIDLAFPSSHIAVLFPDTTDLTFSASATLNVPALSYKVKRDQLKAAGWTVISVKRTQWEKSSKAEKEELVRYIRAKA